jgi:hypothetical protein
VSRGIFGPNKGKETKDWGNFLMRSFIISTLQQILIRTIKIPRVRWVKHAVDKRDENSYKILVRQPEGKRTHGRFKCT